MILAGDIGGTKTLLRLETPEGDAVCERRYANRDYADFGALLQDFLGECRVRAGAAPAIGSACLGVAGPVREGNAQLTHGPWRIDAGALRRALGAREVRLLNDFAAAAHGIGSLGPADLETLQAGTPDPARPRVVIGAGTGMGVAYLLVRGGTNIVIAGEGGHAGYAPRDVLQMELWRRLRAAGGRVQVEDVVSGRGIAAVYAFLRERAGEAQREPEELEPDADAATIAACARSGASALAREALDVFLASFGAAAGDHALTVTARGGVYVAGGIAPKLLWRIGAGGFLRAFNDRGPFSPLARSFPVHVVLNERLGLLGAARLARGGEAP